MLTFDRIVTPGKAQVGEQKMTKRNYFAPKTADAAWKLFRLVCGVDLPVAVGLLVLLAREIFPYCSTGRLQDSSSDR